MHLSTAKTPIDRKMQLLGGIIVSQTECIDDKLLLMVQKSSVHQLGLAVYLIIHKVLYIPAAGERRISEPSTVWWTGDIQPYAGGMPPAGKTAAMRKNVNNVQNPWLTFHEILIV